MSTPDDDGSDLSRARRSFAELRASLQASRTSGSVEQAHAALVDVVDGLLTHVERPVPGRAGRPERLRPRAGDRHQDRRGRLRGIGTRRAPARIRGEFERRPMVPGRDEANGTAHIVHRANAPSGGAVERIELPAFLGRNPQAPEVLELLRLIGRLVD